VPQSGVSVSRSYQGEFAIVRRSGSLLALIDGSYNLHRTRSQGVTVGVGNGFRPRSSKVAVQDRKFQTVSSDLIEMESYKITENEINF
jgi:hypothetical protein